MNMRKVVKLIVFIFGICIFTFGVSITLKSDIGSGSWDGINFGLNKTVGMSVGFWINVNSFIILLITALINKEIPKFISFITAFIIGSFMDFWLYVLGSFTVNDIVIRYGVFFLGVLITCFGIGIYLLPKFPPNPIDYLMVSIKEKYNLKIIQAKIGIDIFCLLGAFIVGGPIGVGTILSTLLVGPGVNLFYDLFSGVYNKLAIRKI
ncbi:YczE/YyaS/YitT family protein [Clostridium ganghwense]|uniref:DUF6198 family protein n=1 Tax=Clostridium ganghwense TaxID=312089 RepID=A0ABT4CPS7_9CLOT|nr:DUF6198 family protein [Clostridium ganghwense]MCY6371061.1 DUF6198 family protein [Clostridium ganghwense]